MIYEYPRFLSIDDCSKIAKLNYKWQPSTIKINSKRYVKPNIRNTKYSDSQKDSYIHGYTDWRIDLHMFIKHNVSTDEHMYIEQINEANSNNNEQLYIGSESWTAMLFLNDSFDDGGVYFPENDVLIEPESGKLVCWKNDETTKYKDIATSNGTKLIAMKDYKKLI